MNRRERKEHKEEKALALDFFALFVFFAVDLSDYGRRGFLTAENARNTKRGLWF